MDANAMVNKAKTWVTVPVQHSFTTLTMFPSISTSLWSSDTIHFSRSNIFIRYLEHVTVQIEFSYSRYRGVTELYLVSPSGTESNLLHYRLEDAVKHERRGWWKWTFMSVHFWWENPVGTWRLKIGSYKGISIVTLVSWSITFYGTSHNPITQERTTVPTTQSKNTSDLKYVSTTTNSASIPTSFTEPTSTCKTAKFLTVTTSDKISTETTTISDWTTLSTKPTTSSRGSALSFLTSDNKPVIIGGFIAGLLLLGAFLVFIRWKINVGRKKAVDSITSSTAPAVFTA
ncbi:unnamed protein product [Mytilus coruscus]|uniref:P/Homo B domain-containing protein n=1 Tax=Mytilus coruscus TaxID=42192 RepID=A0A6J8BPJ1_MYTCO|nr:unnamed protein product [Mytilus coruscus]